MKIFCVILIAWMSFINQAGQDIYACKNVKIALYSRAPIEDINAVSVEGISVYNATTRDLAFSVLIRSFHFRKALMEEHFNENYLESDRFPQATFKGKIEEEVNPEVDGEFPVKVNGVLTVHGISQKRSITGTLRVHQGVIDMTSEFQVKCVDHQIEIPKIVFQNIAESIRVQISATYTAYKK